MEESEWANDVILYDMQKQIKEREHLSEIRKTGNYIVSLGIDW